MVKTLDHLIRFLLEKIALCGTQGAHPSDILQSIEEFYLEPPHSKSGTNLEDKNDRLPRNVFTIDRLFQEQVWRWLGRHPQCQVGPTGLGNKLTLSEVEAANSANLSLEQDVFRNLSQQGQPQVDVRAESVDKASGETRTVSEPNQVQETVDIVEQTQRSEQELRLYTTEDRMWYTITGHGVDFTKIPQLEFTCLCIIAAHGSKGVLQPTLVKISGQDMRSVPRRTQRLYDLGYIVKRPIQTGGARTSLCILKRFVRESSISDRNPQPTETNTESVGLSSEAVLKKCFQGKRVDLYALSRQIFDILNETKLISRQDLITKLGVTSLRWERRIVSIFLRKLAALGCVKQVKALDNIPRPTLRYFRCIKLVREPAEKDSPKLYGASYGKMFPTATEEAEDSDSEDDDVDEYQPDQPADLTATKENLPVNNLKEVERQVPQWTGSGCVPHFIHKLVRMTGTQGMSTMDLKCQAFGKFMQRPVEYQLARLVDRWQISQPLHLRHLAVLRDTALTRRITHYVHYTYENFKKLVENEDAVWEAVVTITKDDKLGQESAVALDAEPKLDKYGFPDLTTTLFQGRENDATPFQCIDALNAAPIHTEHDLTAHRRQDGTYGVQYGSGARKVYKRRTEATSPKSKQISKTRPLGRPRKVPMTSPPTGLTPSQAAKFQESQKAAMRYQKTKAEKEIKKRIDLGQDSVTVRNEVFSEITSQYVLVGQDVPPFLKAFMEQEDVSPKSRAQTPNLSSPAHEDANGPWKSVSFSMESILYLPSIAAHSQPTPIPKNPSSNDSVFQAEATFDRSNAQDVNLLYMPSVAAHSRPILNSWLHSLNSPILEKRRGRGRPAKIKAPTTLDSSTLELTYLQSQQVRTSTLGTSGLKRKYVSSDTSPHDDAGSFQYLPSILAHTRPLLNEQRFPLSQNSLGSDQTIVRPHKKRRVVGSSTKRKTTSKPRVMQEKTYEEQSQCIPREDQGVFIGDDALRARVQGQRGRTKNSRLAIFKSPRLRDFTWFLEEAVESRTDNHSTTRIGQGNTSNTVSIGSTSPSATEAPPALPLVLTSSTPSVNPNSEMGDTDTEHVLSNTDWNGSEIGRITALEMTERDRTLNDLARNKSHDVSAAETGECQIERSGDLRGRIHTISNLPPIISPFNPVNRVDDGISRETAYPQVSREPETTNRKIITSSKICDSLLKTPVLIDPQLTSKGQNDISSETNRLHTLQEPEISSTLPSEPVLGATGSKEGLNEQWEIQSGLLTLDSSSKNVNTGPFEPLDAVLDPSMSAEIMTSYSDAQQPSEFSSTLTNEEAFQLPFTTEASKALPDVSAENAAPLLNLVPESVNVDLHNKKAASHGSIGRIKKRSPALPIQKVAVGGGSLGVLRRKIIMDIVEACGGVYSGAKELVTPFATAWTKQNRPGKPDARTVQTAYKYLVGSGKLRQLTFSFKDAKGLMIIRTMATTADISPTDQKVKDIQKNIISSHPSFYFPSEVNHSEESRHQISYSATYGRNKSINDLELEKDQQVQLQYKPGFDIRFEEQQQRAEMREEASKANRLEFEATRFAETGLWVPVNAEKLLRQRYTRKIDPLRKVERLASVKRRPKRKVDGLFSSNRLESDSTLMMQNSAVRTMEETDLSTLELRNSQSDDTRPRSDFSVIEYGGPFVDGLDQHVPDDSPPGLNEWSASPVGSDRRNTQGPSRAVERLETVPELDSFHGNSSSLGLREPIINNPWDPKIPEGLGTYGEASLARKKSSRRSMNGRRAPVARASLRGKSRPNSLLVGTGESIESPSLSTAMPSSLRPVKRRRIAKSQAIVRYNGRIKNSGLKVYDVPTFMDPHHVFHPTTGTFSVTFSGLATQHRKPESAPKKKSIKKANTAFSAEINRVLAWELDPNYLANPRPKDSPFINHQFEHPHVMANDVDYKITTDFEVHFPSQKAMMKRRPRTHTARSRIGDDGLTKRAQPRSPTAKKKNLKRKRQDESRVSETRGRTSRVCDALDVQPQIVRKPFEQSHVDGRPKKFRRIRGPHAENPISGDDAKRLLIAVTVIRTLVGGIEKNIDWALVSRLFQPKWSQFYVQKRWGHVLHKYRLHVDQIQARFQMIFAKAYEDGTVPAIDFDNLENYDWAWLVEWTTENIDTSKESLQYLPAKRSDLDCFFDLQETNDQDMAEFFEIDKESAWQRRETLINKRPFIYLSEQKQQDLSNPESDVAIAKTWIRANVLTPQATYSSDLARAKLYSIGESTVDTALRELLAMRLLSQQHKGRLVPGRNYDISDYFLSRLKKKLEPSHFRQAIAYKQKLDGGLREPDSIVFPCPAENGEVLAVMNMLAHRRIMVKPKNPPMNKFGLTDGGYRTRIMDKTRLNFDIEIQLRPAYIARNPLSPLPRIPCSHLGDPMAKIPLWYDVHGQPIPVMWELPLAAVLTILAKRPGIAAEVILTSVAPCLEQWELEQMLDWMVRAKVARKQGAGYGLEEWWWMCMGNDEEAEGTRK